MSLIVFKWVRVKMMQDTCKIMTKNEMPIKPFRIKMTRSAWFQSGLISMRGCVIVHIRRLGLAVPVSMTLLPWRLLWLTYASESNMAAQTRSEMSTRRNKKRNMEPMYMRSKYITMSNDMLGYKNQNTSRSAWKSHADDVVSDKVSCSRVWSLVGLCLHCRISVNLVFRSCFYMNLMLLRFSSSNICVILFIYVLFVV